MALQIEHYALIGDCKTAALVDRDGSIDWRCWPRFGLALTAPNDPRVAGLHLFSEPPKQDLPR